MGRLTSPGKVRDAMSLLIAGGLQSGIGFGANIFLARQLDSTRFGQVAVLLATIGLIAGVLSPRFDALIIRAKATGDPGELERQLDDYVAAGMVFGLSVVPLQLIVLFWQDSLGPWSLCLCVATLLSTWAGLVVARYEREGAYSRIASLELAAVAMPHAVAVGMVLVDAALPALLVRELLRGLAIAVMAWVLVPRASRRIRVPGIRRLRDSVARAVPFWLDGGITMGMEHIAPLVARRIGGDALAGQFSIARQLAYIPAILVRPLVTRAMTNWSARIDSAAERVRMVGSVRRFLLLLLLPAGLVTGFGGEFLVSWVYGEEWRLAGVLLSWMAPGIVFFSFAELVRSQFYANYKSEILRFKSLQAGVWALVLLGSWYVTRDGKALAVAFSAMWIVSSLYGERRIAALERG